VSVLNLVERIAREELIELLGDVEPPSPPRATVRPSEEQVAALFAAEFGGECWATFAAGIVDPGFAGRALDLYRFTTPWLPNDEETPVGAAAELLRQIGDGYAMLSHPVERSALPLPLKAFAEVVVRAFGIDAWAAAHGHPLSLDVAEADYQLEHHQDPGTDDRDPDADLDGALEIARRRYELLEVLCDSATGRTALQSEAFQAFAVERLVVGHDWSFWVRTPEEGKAAQRLVSMAQGWFIAAHGGVTSSRDLFAG
jgi:hypothetical protein